MWYEVAPCSNSALIEFIGREGTFGLHFKYASEAASNRGAGGKSIRSSACWMLTDGLYLPNVLTTFDTHSGPPPPPSSPDRVAFLFESSVPEPVYHLDTTASFRGR